MQNLTWMIAQLSLCMPNGRSLTLQWWPLYQSLILGSAWAGHQGETQQK